MKKIYVLIAICFALNTSMLAQQTAINISVYNTSSRFELRRAPFGSQTPQLDSVKTMVFAQDTFEVKKNPVDRNFRVPTRAEIKIKIEENRPNPNSAPKKATDAEIAKVKKNEAKRSCIIETNGLKGKIVLINFDKNCDPAEKCLQAQQAGAYAVIVIYDNNKKDSINMVKSRVSNAITIPCYSIIRQQGDSLRVMLPSKAVFFTPRPSRTALMQQDSLNNTLQQQQVIKEKEMIGYKNNNVNSNIGNGASESTFVRLSPNPTRDMVYINYGFSKIANMRIDIKNIAGQTIFTQKQDNTQTGTLEIATQNWTNGIYWVNITFGEEHIVQKLVVQH